MVSKLSNHVICIVVKLVMDLLSVLLSKYSQGDHWGNCRIQSHSFICSLVEIGDSCFIGHGVTFTNDLFKIGRPSPDPNDWLPTIIGPNVAIGSGATILPVKVSDGIVIGAGAVVTKDLTIKGFYAGNPAKLLRKF